MRRIFVFAVFLLSNVWAFSQTLQYSRVLLVGQAPQTVPVGKVWKVESHIPNQAMRSGGGYVIYIDGDSSYVGTYNSGNKYWANIASITIEWRFPGTCNSTQCNNYGYPYFNFEYGGYENNIPFVNRAVYYTPGSCSYTSSYVTVGTITPQNPGGTLELTRLRMYINGSIASYDIRLTVNYQDGTSDQNVYTGNHGCNTSSTTYLISNGTSAFEVPSRSQNYYSAPVNFPIWLPAGTTLSAGPGVGKISVVEFTEIP